MKLVLQDIICQMENCFLITLISKAQSTFLLNFTYFNPFKGAPSDLLNGALNFLVLTLSSLLKNPWLWKFRSKVDLSISSSTNSNSPRFSEIQPHL